MQNCHGANIDVTQRKQTEAVLKEREASLADALDAGQVMAFEWNAITGQSRRSHSAARIIDDDQSWVDSRQSNQFLKRVQPEDRQNFKAHIKQLSRTNSSYALNFRFCRRDGRQVWLEETARGEFDATGKLLRIKGLTRDITERKHAELALEERNIQWPPLPPSSLKPRRDRDRCQQRILDAVVEFSNQHVLLFLHLLPLGYVCGCLSLA